jgi:hypothetical protein
VKISDPKLMTLSSQSQSSVSDDVLHIDSASKLTPEEIAKAVEHHNRHHKKNKVQKVNSGVQFGKNDK